MSTVLYHGMFPDFTLCSEPKLFFRGNEKARLEMNQPAVIFTPQGKINTATYFNSVSIGKWKTHTQVNSLFLRLKAKGHLILTFKVDELNTGTRILAQFDIKNERVEDTRIDLPFWAELTDGMLYFELEAVSDSEVTAFTYETEDTPVNPVKLGIIITHFNRQDVVLPALSRLKEELLADPEYQDKVALIVVDNSQNLPPVAGVTIIKNRNLGGAGGFSRGLIYLKETAGFTHGLFMDDDASCEAEAIKRTVAFMQFVTDPKVALSGAMLTEREVYRQYESGGYFHGTCKSVGKGMNMLSLTELLKNERPKRVDYGAWWFLAFNLAGIEHNAFPYFVRGDDISFSYGNHLKIETMNGICSWQPDFGAKSSPLTVYLDVRNHLMHPLHGFVQGHVLWSMVRSAVMIYMYQAVGYFYDSAEAANMAIRDVLKGPDFWRDNVDMVKKREEINAMMTTEKPVPIPENLFTEGTRARVETLINPDISDKEKMDWSLPKLFRYLTLNGHLLPTVFFHKGFTWLKKSLGNRMSSTFRYKKVIFLIDGQDQCLILTHSKKKFFGHTWEFVKLMATLAWRYKELQQVYQASYGELTGDEFWRQQFQEQNKKDKEGGE